MRQRDSQDVPFRFSFACICANVSLCVFSEIKSILRANTVHMLCACVYIEERKRSKTDNELPSLGWLIEPSHRFAANECVWHA